MNQLSIITVVKNDLSALKLTRSSIKSLNFPHTWIVIDGGSDPETPQWMKNENSVNVTYLRELDQNLYDAMNKGIKLASGTHLIFINAGDLINKSEKLNRVVENLHIDEGFLGCIRRVEKRNENQKYIVKPRRLAFFFIKYGITPANHQATIYPLSFKRCHPYDTNVGIAADQISILKLLENRKVYIDDSLVICDFKNGGIGDRQNRLAFFKEMFFFRCKNASMARLTFELIVLFPVFVLKLAFSVPNRLRMFRFR